MISRLCFIFSNHSNSLCSRQNVYLAAADTLNHLAAKKHLRTGQQESPAIAPYVISIIFSPYNKGARKCELLITRLHRRNHRSKNQS